MEKDKNQSPTDEQTKQEANLYSKEELEKFISERVNRINTKHSDEIKKLREELTKDIEVSKEKLSLINDITTDELKAIISLRKNSDENASAQIASSIKTKVNEKVETEEHKSKIDISNV